MCNLEKAVFSACKLGPRSPNGHFHQNYIIVDPYATLSKFGREQLRSGRVQSSPPGLILPKVTEQKAQLPKPCTNSPHSFSSVLWRGNDIFWCFTSRQLICFSLYYSTTTLTHLPRHQALKMHWWTYHIFSSRLPVAIRPDSWMATVFILSSPFRIDTQLPVWMFQNLQVMNNTQQPLAAGSAIFCHAHIA